MKKKVFVGCLLLCMMTLLVYSMYIFHRERQATLSDICNLCDEIIHQDKEYRLKETGILSSSGYKSSESDSSTVLYSSGQVEKVAKNTDSSDLITEEKLYRVDQSFLLMENPIDVVVLDSLFNLALQQGGMINVHAALAYTANDDKTVYSNPDLTFYKSACALPPITTGVKDEIVLQAYVEIPFYCVINRSKGHFIIIGIVFCLLLGLLIAIKYNKKFVTPVCEESRTLIKIKENILFDDEKGILYFNTDIQVHLVNYKLKLFVLLLDSPGHFQTSEEIKMIVWEKTGATNDVLNTTIRRLRKDLENIPDLKIVFENGGYRLNIL
ncbi:winged helix-turn-helix domain-containing protein [Parabacteroides sp. TM07-1AC]|uniref:winged helix-turn-helix domain-containing protein n=1 Tax=Parabacteroides sp. TM07-1AC TaxID=2292363 RepID=UPI001314013B|nr:winged helix-turn-helix domain-containing protein [Parabacteroides sp. TM07-1AC]